MRPWIILVTCWVIVLTSIIFVNNLSTEVDAADRVIDGSWVISGNRTVVSNETIEVNGSVGIVNGGTLRLDNCTLTIDRLGGWSAPTLGVGSKGRLEAINTEILGGSKRYRVVIQNDSEFLGCTLRHLQGTTGMDSSIIIEGANVSMKDCLVDDASLYVFKLDGNLTAINLTVTRFEVKAFMVSWVYYYRSISLILEGCRIDGAGDPLWGNAGISMDSKSNEVHRAYVSVRNTTFINLSAGVGFDLYSDHIFEFKGCTFNNTTRAITGSQSRGSLVLMDLDIQALDSNRDAIYLGIDHGANATLKNITIRGFETGIYIEANPDVSDLPLRMDDIRIDMCNEGLVGEAGNQGSYLVLNCYNAAVETTLTSDAYIAMGRTKINLYGDGYIPAHGRCTTQGGMIRAYTSMDLKEVQWRGDGPVTSGTVILEDEFDNEAGSMDIEDMVHMTVVGWQISQTDSFHRGSLIPMMEESGHTFSGPGIDLWNDTSGIVILIDDHTPTISIVSPSTGSLMNHSKVIVEGTYAELGSGVSSVTYWLDQDDAVEVTAVEDGNWTHALKGLSEGDHSLRVVISDRVNNTMTDGPVSFHIDTITPVLLVDEFMDLVNAPTFDLSGTTEPGVDLEIAGEPVDIGPDGTFVHTYQLVEGVNMIILRVHDEAGNWNVTALEVTLDTVPPQLSVESPTSGIWTNASYVMVQGTVEPHAELTVDDVVVDSSMGEFEHRIDLPQGLIEIHIIAIDAAGNDVRIALSLHVDQTAPSLSLNEPTTLEVLTREDTISVSGEVIEQNLTDLKINSEPLVVAAGYFAKTYHIGEGENTFSIVALDMAGNEDSIDLIVVRDTMISGNTVTDLYPVDGEWVEIEGIWYSTTHIQGLRVETEEVTTLYVSGVEVSGPGMVHDIHLELEEGSNVLLIKVVDEAGNEETVMERSLFYDSISPEIQILEPLPGITSKEKHLTVRGLTVGAVLLKVNGVEVTISPGGDFQTVLTLVKGPNQIEVEVWDAIGNFNSTNLQITYEPKEPAIQDGIGQTLTIIVVIALVVVALVGLMFMKRMKKQD